MAGEKSEPRRARRRQQVRQAILAAADELFARHGYERVTIRSIAQRISYSQGVIFYHFRNKSEILDALCRETYQGLLDRLQQLTAAPGDARGRLLAASRAFIEFGRAHPHHFRTVFYPFQTREKQRSVDGLGGIGRPIFQLLGEMFRAACPPEDSSPMAEIAWWSAVIGVTSFLIVHEESPWVQAEAVIKELLVMLSQGLAFRAAEGQRLSSKSNLGGAAGQNRYPRTGSSSS